MPQDKDFVLFISKRGEKARKSEYTRSFEDVGKFRKGQRADSLPWVCQVVAVIQSETTRKQKAKDEILHYLNSEIDHNTKEIQDFAHKIQNESWEWSTGTQSAWFANQMNRELKRLKERYENESFNHLEENAIEHFTRVLTNCLSWSLNISTSTNDMSKGS